MHTPQFQPIYIGLVNPEKAAEIAAPLSVPPERVHCGIPSIKVSGMAVA